MPSLARLRRSSGRAGVCTGFPGGRFFWGLRGRLRVFVWMLLRVPVLLGESRREQQEPCQSAHEFCPVEHGQPALHASYGFAVTSS